MEFGRRRWLFWIIMNSNLNNNNYNLKSYKFIKTHTPGIAFNWYIFSKVCEVIWIYYIFLILLEINYKIEDLYFLYFRIKANYIDAYVQT